MMLPTGLSRATHPPMSSANRETMVLTGSSDLTLRMSLCWLLYIRAKFWWVSSEMPRAIVLEMAMNGVLSGTLNNARPVASH